MSDSAIKRSWYRPAALVLLVPPLGALGLLAVTIRNPSLNEPYFVASTYYVLLVLLLVYAGLQLPRLREMSPRTWVIENRAGLLVTAAVSCVVLFAVPASFRVLADEANLVGVSKNLFLRHTANFAVTGKWYFENFWQLSLVTDRRPALYPFLVSLLHLVRGYHPENAFHMNAILFVCFVFSCYRLGKTLGGELLGLSAAVLVAANPNTLVAARSGGFDFLSAFVLLMLVRNFADYLRDKSARQLALLALTLCLFAHVRYEGSAMIALVIGLLLVFKLAPRARLAEFGWVYSLCPAFLLPRYWQAVAKAHDAEQPLSAALFSLHNFNENLREYLGILREPLNFEGPHAPLLLSLALVGFSALAFTLARAFREKRLAPQTLHFVVFVGAVVGLQMVICFSYFWGKSLHAAACRLFVWLDTAVAFGAAWALTLGAKSLARRVSSSWMSSAMSITLLSSAALFSMHLPTASEARFVNVMIVTREAAQTWRFFEKLGEKRIMILTDRPGLFTIMDYGAVDISGADANRGLLNELSRKLYKDAYLVQEVDLETRKPLPGFDVWQDVPTDPVEEFQNTDSSFVRISRVRKSDPLK